MSPAAKRANSTHNVPPDIMRNKKWVVFDGEKLGEEFETTGRVLEFSPDGRRVAYTAKINGKWHLIAGSRRSGSMDRIEAFRFSQDGRKVAFGALLGRELWWKVLTVE